MNSITALSMELVYGGRAVHAKNENTFSVPWSNNCLTLANNIFSQEEATKS